MLVLLDIQVIQVTRVILAIQDILGQREIKGFLVRQ